MHTTLNNLTFRRKVAHANKKIRLGGEFLGLRDWLMMGHADGFQHLPLSRHMSLSPKSHQISFRTMLMSHTTNKQHTTTNKQQLRALHLVCPAAPRARRTAHAAARAVPARPHPCACAFQGRPRGLPVAHDTQHSESDANVRSMHAHRHHSPSPGAAPARGAEY